MLTKINFTLVVVMLATLSPAPAVVASVQTGDIVRFGDGPGSPGGIFYLQDSAGNKLFDTFCVQIEEYIRFGKNFKVANSEGNASAGVGSRPLTSFAAWLYDRYLNGIEGSGTALSNFDFANAYGQVSMSSASIQANQLQLAIWVAMGYTSTDIGGVLPGGWYATYSGKVAGWNADWLADSTWSKTGIGGIRVVNLLAKDTFENYTIGAQDQLQRIIPEPMSAVVWSVLAIAVAGVIKLRR